MKQIQYRTFGTLTYSESITNEFGKIKNTQKECPVEILKKKSGEKTIKINSQEMEYEKYIDKVSNIREIEFWVFYHEGHEININISELKNELHTGDNNQRIQTMLGLVDATISEDVALEYLAMKQLDYRLQIIKSLEYDGGGPKSSS
jgi:hypothetical protein